MIRRILIAVICLAWLCSTARAQSGAGNVYGGRQFPALNGTQLFKYSAAGTAVPTCNASNDGVVVLVSDQNSASCVDHAAYSSGGSTTCVAQCLNGTGWIIIGGGAGGGGVNTSLLGQSPYYATTSTVSGGRELKPCAFAGATADVQINAAVTALPSGGGVIDASCYGATAQTIAGTITLGSSSKSVTFKYDMATAFTCTITNGSACISDPKYATIIGSGQKPVRGATGGWFVGTSANISGLIVGQNGAGIDLENFYVNSTAGGTINTALVYVSGPTGNDVSIIKGYTVDGGTQNTTLLKIDNSSQTSPAAPIDLVDNDLDCESVTGCHPLLIQQLNTAFLGQVNIYGGYYQHGVAGSPEIDIEANNSTNTPVQAVALYGVNVESNNSTDIGVYANGVAPFTVAGFLATCGLACGADVIKLGTAASWTDSVNIMGLRQDGWTNSINNVINSTTVKTMTVDYYSFNQAAGGSNGQTFQLQGVPIQMFPAPLANWGTCNAAREGADATATNCSSTTLGTTCSGSGATHAKVYCNGTNWVQVGY